MLLDLQNPQCCMSAPCPSVGPLVARTFPAGCLPCSLLLGQAGSLYNKGSIRENRSHAGEPGIPTARMDGNNCDEFSGFEIFPFLQQGKAVLWERMCAAPRVGSSLGKKPPGLFQPGEASLSQPKRC